MRKILPMSVGLVLACLKLQADEPTYEQRFSEEYGRVGIGWVSNATLVDTNNLGPALEGKPLSFSRFQGAGELGGIRLGLTMSQVVAAWGKPRALFTRCGKGPRFSYGHGAYLFFREGRLVRISLGDRFLERLAFDNGFRADMRRPQVEALLGSPAPRRADQTGPLQGDVYYLSGGVHMSISFHDVPRTPTSAWQVEAVDGIAVGLDDEPQTGRPGEPNASPNAAAPHR